MGRATKQNKLTTPEHLAQVNKENIRLKEDFLRYLKSTQRSYGTIQGYNNDLDIFFVWNLLNNGNKEYVKVTKRDIVAFQDWMMSENENSPARVRRVKAALSSLGNYVENILDDEYPEYRSIVRKIENPANQPVREKTVLTERQIDNLLYELSCIDKCELACMVALAASCGARKSELTQFKVEYFDDKNLICGGSLWKTNEKMKTKGQGLGKYIYKYIVVSSFKPYLDQWMAYREKHGIDSVWLFPRSDNPHLPIRVSQMNSWAQYISNLLNVDFYWHSLRHYCCTNLYRQNIPDSVIQLYFGWASQDMVGVYKDVDEDEELEAYFNSFDDDEDEKSSKRGRPKKASLADLK